MSLASIHLAATGKLRLLDRNSTLSLCYINHSDDYTKKDHKEGDSHQYLIFPQGNA